MHKICAGNGYLYLMQNVATGDVQARAGDAAGYYTARGNPPGYWLGAGIAGLDLAVGGRVSAAQMKALYGEGKHPDAEDITAAFMAKHTQTGMSLTQVEQLEADADKAARLGRQFSTFRAGSVPFDERVAKRLERIEAEAGRAPTVAEIGKVKAEESRRATNAVAGFDHVFTPPKSVSLLWALHPNAFVRQEVKAAYNAAMREAFQLLERHAAHTRTGAGGVAQINTRGLVAVAFDHFDNRHGEPNLHTHLVVSNKVQGVDGVWRALDARGLHRIAVAASELYDTALRTELSARLGVEWEIRADTTGHREPVAEIKGIQGAWIKAFSTRRANVETELSAREQQYRDDHGKAPEIKARKALAREANLATRPAKPEARSLRELITDWCDQFGTRFGNRAVKQLAATVPANHARNRRAVEPGVDMEAVAARVVAEVAERHATWTRWTVEAQTHRTLKTQGIGFTSRHQQDAIVAGVVDAATNPRHSVDITPPSLTAEPAALRRVDGASVFTQHGAQRFTSAAVLDAETALVAAATTDGGVATGRGVADVAVAGFEQRYGRLDAGQKGLATAFACYPKTVVAGIGPAGSGKTTAMRALASILDADSRRLIPLATSGASAAVLAAELGVPAENVHKFIAEHTTGRFHQSLRSGEPVPRTHALYQVRAGDVILVDEAGMAGTLNLARVLSIAQHHGATVRLLGDHRQLSAVESGGALRLIASAAGAVELSTLHRFTDPNEARATLKLRVGNGSGLDFYAGNDRVHAGDKESMLAAAYDAWRADMLAGKVSVLIAATNTDVADLSTRARADRINAGQVEAGGVELHDANTAGVGDWIVTRHPDRRLATGAGEFVRNGDTWHVTNRHTDGSLTVRHFDHGGRLMLPGWYVAQHVELAYATTVHRSLGSTVDTAHPVITEAMTREALYVAATRARQRTDLYVATTDQPADDDAKLHTPPGQAEARAILETIVISEGAEKSATETIRELQDAAGRLATLVPQLEYAAQQYTDTAGEATVSIHDALPWARIPVPANDANRSLMDSYVDQLREQVAARVETLAESAIREQPAWMRDLGTPPDSEDAHKDWRQQVATVAAYRDHHQITGDAPAGPWVEKNQPGHAAFTAALKAAVEARRIAERDHPTAGGVKPSQVDFRSAMRAAQRDHTGHHRAPQPKRQPAQHRPAVEPARRPTSASPTREPAPYPAPMPPPQQPQPDPTQQPQPRL